MVVFYVGCWVRKIPMTSLDPMDVQGSEVIAPYTNTTSSSVHPGISPSPSITATKNAQATTLVL